MRTRSLLPAAVLLCGCALHRRPVAPEPARGPARDSLFRLDQSRSDSVAARGLLEGMLTLLGPQVVYLRGGVPAVYGRDGARALLSASSPPNESITWQPLGGGVSRDLASAFTYGVAARVIRPGTAPRLDRYIAYWERAPRQPWRIMAYSEVGAPPAAGVHVPRDYLEVPVRQAPKRIAEGISEVREADSLFSDLADRMGTAFAFSNTVAPDGLVFGSPELVIGPKAVQEYYAAAGGGTALTWHPVFAAVASSLDLGFTIGEYSATSRGPSGAAVQRFGKYLTVWRREPDGSWKFVVDGGSPTPGVER
jgi:ketosteroid isomerase-like protein